MVGCVVSGNLIWTKKQKRTVVIYLVILQNQNTYYDYILSNEVHNAVSREIWYEAHMNDELEGSKAKWSLFYIKDQTNSCSEGMRKTMETSVGIENANLGSEPHISHKHK